MVSRKTSPNTKEAKEEANGAWAEYRRLVLAELQRLHEDVEHLKTDCQKRDIAQAKLTAKLAVYAGIGSILGGAGLSLLVHYLSQ